MFLNVKQVAARYGIEKTQIWRWIKDPENNFPEPHRFGPQTLRWKLEDLEAWEASTKEGADQ